MYTKSYIFQYLYYCRHIWSWFLCSPVNSFFMLFHAHGETKRRDASLLRIYIHTLIILDKYVKSGVGRKWRLEFVAFWHRLMIYELFRGYETWLASKRSWTTPEFVSGLMPTFLAAIINPCTRAKKNQLCSHVSFYYYLDHFLHPERACIWQYATALKKPWVKSFVSRRMSTKHT